MEALASSANWLPEGAGTETPPHGNRVLYGQVWEDADVLLDALDVRPGHVCVTIASAGDNALALLSHSPARVIAIDRNRTQLFCLELRVAAYRSLMHEQLLELLGSRPSERRAVLYERCRHFLSPPARAFWDAHPAAIARGAAGSGRFEQYLAMFRRWVLPFVHSNVHIERLLRHTSPDERARFYDEEWNTWRWRLLFRAFFSRAVMRRLGREPQCFAYVTGDVSAPILARTRHALTALDPSSNPYVHWILTGTHGEALPYALRPEHFDVIRNNLTRLECRCETVRAFVDAAPPHAVDRWNLSDVFEYVSLPAYVSLLASIVDASRVGARLAYWNLLADRTCPPALAAQLRPDADRAAALHLRDRAFFYRRLVIEEVMPCS
jgi:S-adenosylmethionine-diacylglycerol 3-amino-3-carboxypropyl transferase